MPSPTPRRSSICPGPGFSTGHAEVAHLAAHPDRATELVREAIARVDPDDRHLHGWLHERLGRYLWMSADTRHALAAYERAVELVPAEPADPWASRRAERAVADADAGGSVRRVRGAGARGDRSGPQVPDGRSVEGHARCNLGVDLTYTGRLEDGIAELREARRIAEEQFDDVDDIARAMVNLHSVLFDAGRIEESAEVALESVAVVETLGLQRRKGVWSRCDAVEVLLILGRLDEAGQLMDEARLLQPQGVDAFRTDVMDGQLLLRRGDVDRARSVLERAEAAGTQIIDPHLLAPLYATLVELATWQGDDDAAARWSEDGVSRLDRVAHPAHVAPVLAAAATAAVRADPPRLQDARALLDRAATLIEATTARGAPGGGRGARGGGRAVRRRDGVAGRGHCLGRTGRALPGDVRPPAGGRGAAGHGRRPR